MCKILANKMIQHSLLIHREITTTVDIWQPSDTCLVLYDFFLNHSLNFYSPRIDKMFLNHSHNQKYGISCSKIHIKQMADILQAASWSMAAISNCQTDECNHQDEERWKPHMNFSFKLLSLQRLLCRSMKKAIISSLNGAGVQTQITAKELLTYSHFSFSFSWVAMMFSSPRSFMLISACSKWGFIIQCLMDNLRCVISRKFYK